MLLLLKDSRGSAVYRNFLLLLLRIEIQISSCSNIKPHIYPFNYRSIWIGKEFVRMEDVNIPLSLAYIKSYLFVISIARKVMPLLSLVLHHAFNPFPSGWCLSWSITFFFLLQFEKESSFRFIFVFFKIFEEKIFFELLLPDDPPGVQGSAWRRRREKKALLLFYGISLFIRSVSPNQQPRSGTCALWQEKRLVPAFYFYC